MRRSGLLTTLVVGLVLGIGLLVVIYIRDHLPGSIILQGETSYTQTPDGLLNFPVIPTEYKKPQEVPTKSVQISEALPWSGANPQVLLLYDGKKPTTFSINYCKIAQFYGVDCYQQDINSQIPLEKSMLFNAEGKPYKLIGLDSSLLDPRDNVISDREILLIKEMVKTEGSTLLVGKLDSTIKQESLGTLTEGEVTGVSDAIDSTKDWHVSDKHPEITFELSGLSIKAYQMVIPDTASIQSVITNRIIHLITSRDNSGSTYTVFMSWQPSSSSGMVFLDSGENGQSMDIVPMRDVYYSAASFTQIIPTMMVFRYVFGDEVWHRDMDYANLTIDESVLIEPYQSLNYTFLLEKMRQHNFHTTISVIPEDWRRSDPYVVAMFLANPEFFSLVQYGNTGEGYEFYRYEVASVNMTGNMLVPVRSLSDQEYSIQEGNARIKLLENLSGLTIDPVMILPGGICPVQTFELLKKNGYLATSNVQDTPLDSPRMDDWDYGMEPAITDYAAFPNLIRRMPEASQAYEPYLLASILDIFVDKPALFYTFPYGRSMFANGMDAFDQVADEMNSLNANLEWRSLGDIARSIYLERKNVDGSTQVKMVTSELIYQNDSNNDEIVHISRPVTDKEDIDDITVNGYSFPYRLEAGEIIMDIRVPGNSKVRITIEYSS